MPKIQTKKQEFVIPDEIKKYFSSAATSEVNIKIAEKFHFSVGQLARLTVFVGDLFYGRREIDNCEKELVKALGVNAKQAKDVALEILGRRLLVVDEYFRGKVSRKIIELGGNAQSFQETVKKLVADTEEEQEIAREEERVAREAELKEARAELARKRSAAAVRKIDPVKERPAFREIFGRNIMSVVRAEDFEFKAEMNMRLATVLLSEAEHPEAQKEYMDELYKNQEQLTRASLLIKGEKMPGTVGNWLRDYIAFVGVDEAVSTIKKAQYFVQSENAKTLSEQEKEWLDRLLDIYINLKNFYANVSKMDLEDVVVFPYTPAESAAFMKLVEEEMRAEEAASGAVAARAGESAEKVAGPVDIAALYRGKPADEAALADEKKRLVAETRREARRLADLLTDYLLRRRRIPIIACLELLAESGALDNVLAEDKRFQDYLFKYFKRNNLSGEIEKFSRDKYAPRYVIHFLKFVFLERLGLPEQEGARLAAKIAGAFRANGAAEYGALAYLDLEAGKFVWGEVE